MNEAEAERLEVQAATMEKQEKQAKLESELAELDAMDDDAAIAMAASRMGLDPGASGFIEAEDSKGKAKSKGKGKKAKGKSEGDGANKSDANRAATKDGDGKGRDGGNGEEKEDEAEDEEEDWELPEALPGNFYNRGIVENLLEVIFPRSMKVKTTRDDLVAERNELRAKVSKIKKGKRGGKQKKS